MDTKDKKAESLRSAVDELRQAAEKVAERIVGPDVASHLRQAARHAARAARQALEEVERHCAEKAGDTPAPKPPGDTTAV